MKQHVCDVLVMIFIFIHHFSQGPKYTPRLWTRRSSVYFLESTQRTHSSYSHLWVITHTVRLDFCIFILKHFVYIYAAFCKDPECSLVYKESKRTNFSVGAFSSDPCRTDSFLTSTHSYLSSTYCNSNLFLSTAALERECFTQRLQDNSNYNNDSLSTLRVPLQALELLPQTQKPFL